MPIKNKQIIAIYWSLLGSLCFTTAMTFAKFLSPEIKGPMLVFFRCSFGFLFFLPFLLKDGLLQAKQKLATKRLPLHMLRVFFTCFAIGCTYYGYRMLDLAIATSIGFTAPLMTTALSALVFKEKITLNKWILITIAYCGVLISFNPDLLHISPSILCLIAANFFASCSIICTKKLTQTESTLNMLFYVTIISAIVSGSVAAFHWVSPTLNDYKYLIPLGMCGAISQLCYIQSLRHAEPSFIAPFEYIRLIYASVFGYLFLSETLTLRTLIGATVIIIATTLATRIDLKQSK